MIQGNSIRRGRRETGRGLENRTSRHAPGLNRLSERLGAVGSAHPNESGAMKVAWAAAVGSSLSRRTRLAGMTGGRLLVEVADPAWQRAVQANYRRIKERLKTLLGPGAPTTIEVQVAPNMATPPPEEETKDQGPQRSISAPKICPQDLLDGVVDESLRRAIARAYLAHHRRYGGEIEADSSRDKDPHSE